MLDNKYSILEKLPVECQNKLFYGKDVSCGKKVVIKFIKKITENYYEFYNEYSAMIMVKNINDYDKHFVCFKHAASYCNIKNSRRMEYYNINDKVLENVKDLGYFVFENADYSLKDFIDNFILNNDRCINIVSQIIKCVEYLHKHGIYHCDLKADNFLVFNDCGEIVVKLCDFGYSTKKLHDDRFVGSPLNMAPETINKYHLDNAGHKGDNNLKKDIYSLGCTIYEVIYRKHPYEESRSIHMLLEMKKLHMSIIGTKQIYPIFKNNKDEMTNGDNVEYYKFNILIKTCMTHNWVTRPNISLVVMYFESLFGKYC